MAKVTEQQIEDYQRDGAVCLRSVLSAEQIELLRSGIQANLQNLSPRAKVASNADDPGYFVEDFCNWQTNSAYKQFLLQSDLGEIAARLMRSSTARLYHDHLLVKEPGTRQRTPWHQDQPYYNIDGKQNCSMWIAVDAVARQSTLELVAGSHLGPWLMPRSFRDNQAKWFPDGSLAELPNIDKAPENFPIIGWEVSPGDIVCFHMLTLHASGPVGGESRRRVFSARFLGDDIVHAPRPWVTSPEFPGLTDELPAGAPMDHALFPLLWQEKE